MTLREIVSYLLAIKCRLYSDLTPEERSALSNACAVFISLATALEGIEK